MRQRYDTLYSFDRLYLCCVDKTLSRCYATVHLVSFPMTDRALPCVYFKPI
jgi:hypothetical protein